LFSATFAFFLAPERMFPGAPWMLAGALMLTSLAIAVAVVPHTGSENCRLAEADATE
jgi:hypothetical protein